MHFYTSTEYFPFNIQPYYDPAYYDADYLSSYSSYYVRIFEYVVVLLISLFMSVCNEISIPVTQCLLFSSRRCERFQRTHE